MLDRVLKYDGFYEYFSASGTPQGSSNFRGAAGVLARAIEMVDPSCVPPPVH